MDINSFVIGYKKGKASGGGGVELNIAYGDTAPEDTSKLWVKTSEPNEVIVSNEVEQTETDGESYYTLPITLPYPVAQAGCGVIGSKVYIIGGRARDDTGLFASKSVIVYDTETKTFEVLKDVLGDTGIVNICCAVVGTRIYFVGGGSASTTTSNLIRYFDTESKQLVVCNATMPTAHYGFVCASWDKAVYIFGGQTGSKFPQTAYKYETETDTYTTLGDVKCVYSGRCIRQGSIFYMFGDHNGPNQATRYNADTNVTTTKTIGGSGSEGRAGGILDDYLYWFSGRGNTLIQRVKTSEFDTYGSTMIIETLPFSTHKTIGYAACATIGNKIYAFGGSTSGSTSTMAPIDEVNVFSLATPLPVVSEGTLVIKPKAKDNIFPIINSDVAKVEIGVELVYKGNADGIGEEVEAALYKDGAWTTI